MSESLPDLTGWEPTRDTLHLYSKALGAVRRTLAEPHPLWWHISLRVTPEGLTTGELPAPGGEGSLSLLLDLRQHRLDLTGPGGGRRTLALDEGLTAADFGRRVLELLGEVGAAVEVDPASFTDDTPRAYDRRRAEAYLQALNWVEARFADARREMAGETGPIQLWPHHFDLAFEWLGERKVPDEDEEGRETEARSQIGYGFSPGDESHPAPYFYANPWPFETEFTIAPLPPGAEWHSEGWEGGLLPYAAVRRGGKSLLARFLQAVYDAAAPVL